MHAAFRSTIRLVGIPALTVAAACAATQASADTTTPESLTSASARLAPSGAASATTSLRSRADGPLRLEADISERQLHLYQGGELVKSYAVAVGTAKDPTPRGRFSIRKLVWNPAWVPPDEEWARKKTAKAPGQKGNPMKVVKIFFREPDYYIHGTGEVSSLGTAASHGCLRMAPAEAAELGQYVMDHGGQPRDESWFRRIWRFRSQTKVVYLKNPVPLTITD